jgi:hypothetical protein
MLNHTNQVYYQWGRQTCQAGANNSLSHTDVYRGAAYSNRYGEQRSEHICMDENHDQVAEEWSDCDRPNSHCNVLDRTSSGPDYAMLSPVEVLGDTGHHLSPETGYPEGRELGCVACATGVGDGAVFTHWGANSCPRADHAHLYRGFMASSGRRNKGGGHNFLCLHKEPEYPKGYNDKSHIEEGSNTYSSWVTGVEGGVACTVCQAAPDAITTYVQWGRYTCSGNHTTEYSGAMMSGSSDDRKSEWICVNKSQETVGTVRDGALIEKGSHVGAGALQSRDSDQYGSLRMTDMLEGTGHTTEYPGGYPAGQDSHGMHPGCAVCSTTIDQGAPYVRWGSRNCGRDIHGVLDPSVKKVYEGFMANSRMDQDNNGGSNYVCMHETPEYESDGYPSVGNSGGDLVGVEYGCADTLYAPNEENQYLPPEHGNWGRGTQSCGDGNRALAAACTVCERPATSQVYTQWGRMTCSHGHTLEYAGIIMSTGERFTTFYRSEYICVDPRREGLPRGTPQGALFDDIDQMEQRDKKACRTYRHGDQWGESTSCRGSEPYGHGTHRITTAEMRGSVGHHDDDRESCGIACGEDPYSYSQSSGAGMPEGVEMGCAVCSVPAY